MIRPLVIVSCAISLISCATAYQSNGLTGGFSETQISENVWRVVFNGNGYTSRERAEDFALLRSAELTLRQGFKFFALASTRTNDTTSAITTPSTANTTGTIDAYGNLRTKTTIYGGQIYFVSKPSNTNVVVMLKEKIDANIDAIIFDASFICKSIGGKYKVECS